MPAKKGNTQGFKKGHKPAISEYLKFERVFHLMQTVKRKKRLTKGRGKWKQKSKN